MSTKILIIEHDEPLGDELMKAFKEKDYACHIFREGTEGFKKISELKPDVLVLDETYHDVLATELKTAGMPGLPAVFVSPAGDFKKTVANALEEIKEKAVLGTTMPDLKGKKILWVEDDKLIASVLVKKFSVYGCDISLFKNGAEAVTWLEKNKPDVVVLDLLLPGMSGFDILKKIRSIAGLEKVPVLILSNLNQPADIQKARAMGASKFLVKAAVSLNDIVKEVEGLLKK